MRKQKQHILLYLICCLSLINLSVYAQKSSARVTVEPAEILIGEHAIVNLEVIAPKGRDIIFPIYPDTLVNGIEVLLMLPPDTVVAHEVMTINQKYIITSFDSTLYYVPYMAVIDGMDTIKSEGFGLKVSSVMLPDQVMAYLDQLKKQETDSIDFEQLQLSDIKPILKAPFVWQDYLAYLWVALLVFVILALIGVGIYLALRKKNKGYFFKPEVILPPHEIAIKALDKIKSEKLWQQGLEKEFYTELTGVLRGYIEGRFDLNAFEKTSDEIIDSMKSVAEADSSTDSLKQILKLADLVKFAKHKPMLNENDLSLANAYLFINQTKIEPPVNEAEEGKEKAEKNDNNIVSKNTENKKANS